MFQKFYLKIIFISCVFSGFVCAQKRSVDEIQKNYQEPLEYFLPIKEKQLLGDGLSMNHFFLIINKPSDGLIMQMRSDNTTLKKELKKLKKLQRLKNTADLVLEKNIQELKQYNQDYLDMFSYIKKYDLNNNVVVFHEDLKKRWSAFLDCINQGGDIIECLPKCGIHEQDIAGLTTLIKLVKQDQRKISEYEDRLHTDWIDLKLANYVFKIELIRLRNAALFHPLYNGPKLKSGYPR